MKRFLVFLAILTTTASGQGFNIPVGQETMANSMPVVIASDQSSINFGVTQVTTPWIVAGGGTAGSSGTAVLTVQGIAGGTPEPVSGTITANAGTGTFTVGQATATNLKAQVVGAGTAGAQSGGVVTIQGDPSGTPIPISGSITASNASIGPTGAAVPANATYVGIDIAGNLIGLTAGQATMANSIPVTIASDQPNIGVIVPDITSTGTITSTQSVTINTAGYGTVGVLVTGTFTGTIFVEWSADGVNFNNTTYANITTGSLSLTFTAAGAGTIQCSGASQVRLRGSTVASGTATVYLRANVATSQVMLDNPLPTGSNTIGAVNQAGSNWTQNITQFGGNNVVTGTGAGGVGIPRVTVSNDSTVGLVAGSAIIGKVGIDQTTPGTTNAVSATNLPTTVDTNYGAVGASSLRIAAQIGNATGAANFGAGTTSAQTLRVVLPTDQTSIPVTTTATTAAATFQDGSIAFGSLTTSFATVITAGGVLKHVDMRNNTNGIVVVSLDSGSTTAYTLDPGDAVSLDLAINGSKIASSTTLQAKYSGSAPTVGSIRINGWY